MRLIAVLVLGIAALGTAEAQEIITGVQAGSGHRTEVTAPPSVDAGIADGNAKRAGAPSVGDGRANGVVKSPGAPSVGDGVANGVVKSTTVNQ